jgi:hypothetical protein
MISLGEALLVLRGWCERKRPLRVQVESPETMFSAFCTLYKVEGETVNFWIGAIASGNGISFSLTGCRFDFGDVPADAPDAVIPVLGGTVESGLMGTRGTDFKIAIMLLKSPPQ